MLFGPTARSQTPQNETHEQRAARFRRMSIDAETKGLAEPFKGITTQGRVEPGLFSIRSSGVSTGPVRAAADAFLAVLTKAQRDKTMFDVDDSEWRKWMNQDYYVRLGVSFLEMTDAQRQVAIELLRAALSAKGLKQTRDIMRLNETLAELNDNDFDRYGEWRYHITVMGKPSATEPWGWQLDGHHAIINYFVLGDQVVMTPMFAGSEPVVATSGKHKGTSVLQDEQNKALALLRRCPMPEAEAILRVSKTGNEIGRGLEGQRHARLRRTAVADMSEAQRKQLLDLAALYLNNMDDGHARVKMDEVRQHLDRTWFAWIGTTEQGGVFYYRIHSPVILIEFDHQVPANLKQYAKDPNAPNPQHIHVVVRTPNGNDYGKDLLREHYRQHPHTTAGNLR